MHYAGRQMLQCFCKEVFAATASRFANYVGPTLSEQQPILGSLTVTG
jgi:hypothetical protein